MLHGVRCRCGSFGIDDMRWQIKSTCISLHCRCSLRRCVLLPVKKRAKYKEFSNIHCTCCCCFFLSQNLKLVTLTMARHVTENGTHHGEGWKETSTKAFHLQQCPYWVCLFQSPICFVLRPFQFVYIWPLLERDSLLIYCPLLPESAVKSAQGPPASFGPCSYIVSPGRWLLFQRQAMQGKALPEHHKDLTGEKKKKKKKRKSHRTKAWETAAPRHNVAASE